MTVATQIVPGSLAAVTMKSNAGLAESFLHVDVLLIVDTSGSMDQRDAPGGRSRYQAACDELQALQRQMPGKIGVISFASNTAFCPGGVPTRDVGGGTDMVAALKFVKPADGLGIRFILISDGEPDDAAKTLAVARTFQTHIDVVYIGAETGCSGRDFLQRLAKASSGQYIKSAAVGLLADPVMKLLSPSR